MNTIIVTFLFLISTKNYAKDFVSGLSQSSKTPDEFISLPKEASYINLDSFNGSLITGFKLPIAKLDKELSSNIHFSYNSTRYRNLGYGLGFEILTPKFYPNPLGLRSNYIFEYNGKSIEYNFDETSGKGHETELTFFTNAQYSSDKLQIIITFPEGKRLYFDIATGSLIKEQSSYKKAFLNYSWEDGSIKKISVYNDLEINFNYQPCNYDEDNKHKFIYGSYYKGSYIDTAKCLLTVTYKKQLSENKVDFSYSKGHLEAVAWENNNVMKIFDAKYSNNIENNQDRIDQTLKSITGSTSKDHILISKGKFGQEFLDKEKIIRDMQLRPASEGAGFNDSVSLANSYFADIDNDGVTDVIIESMEHIQGKKDDDILSPDDYDDNDSRIPLYGAHNIRVYRGVVDPSSRKYSLINSSPYQLNESFKTMVPTCRWNPHRHRNPMMKLCNQPKHKEWEYNDIKLDETYQFQVFSHSSLLVGDFNGDGAIDIVSCGANNFIAYNGYGTFATPKKHQFPCTSSTTAIDINQDGLSDLISGKGVFINKGYEKFVKLSNDADFSELIIYHQKVKQANDIVMSGQNNHYNKRILTELSDKYKDKTLFRKLPTDKYEIVDDSNFKFQGVNAVSKHTIVYHSSDSKWVESNHYKNKKISTYTNMYGGKTEVNYTVNGPKSVLKNTVINNLDNKTKTDYIYAHPILEPILNQFIGYQLLKKRNFENRKIKSDTFYIFFTDNKLSDSLKRVPIHGQVDTIAHCEPDTCSNIDSILKNNNFTEIDFNQAKTLKIYNWKVKDLSDLTQRPSYFKYNSKNLELINYKNNQTVKSSENLYSDYSLYGPLTLKKRTQEGANFPYPIGGRSPVPYQEIIKKFKVIESRKLLSTLEENNFSKTYLPIKTTHFDYQFDNEFLRKVTTTQGIQKQTIEKDDFGRTTSKTNGHGFKISTGYPNNNEKTIVIRDGDNETIFEYDLLRNLQKETKTNKKENVSLMTKYSYDAPFLLKSVAHHDKTYTYQFNKLKNLSITITNEKAQSNTEMKYDQMGNLVEKYEQDSNKVKRLVMKKSFNASSKLLKEYLPNDLGNDILHYSFEYDLLGRTTKSIDHLLDITSKYEYKDAYLNYYINDKLIYKKRLTQSGVLANYELSDDYFEIDQSLSKNIVSVKNNFDEMYYEYDQNNNISEIHNSIGRRLYFETNTLKERFINNGIKYIKDNQDNIIKFDEKYYFSIDLKHDGLNRLKSMKNSFFRSLRSFTYLDDNKLDQDIIEIEKNKLVKKINYNYKNQLLSEKFKLGPTILDIGYEYENDRISKIKKFIKNIEYNEFGHMTKIEYINGITVNYNYSRSGELLSFSTGSYLETNHYNSFGKVFKIVTNINKKQREVESLFEYTDDLRLINKPLLKQSQSNLKRNGFFSLILPGVFTHKSRLIDTEDFELVSQGFDQALGLLSPQGRTRYFSMELHYRNGVFTRYLFVANKLVGAITISKTGSSFFPIVTDSRNSVRLIYNETKELIAMKNYDAWGFLHLEESFSKNKIDERIQYDYALLKRFNEKSKYLISNSRVYYPAFGEWITIDPLLFSSPNKLLTDSIFEANGLSYAKSDPLNFVDPSGHAAFAIRNLENMPVRSDFGVLDKLNIQVAHEQLFYHDTMGSIGHGDKGPIPNESFTGRGYKWNNERTYNDDLMRISVSNSPMGEYNLLGVGGEKNNCQDWADRVRSTYNDFESSYFIDRDSFGLNDNFFDFNDRGSDQYNFGSDYNLNVGF